MLSHSLDIVMQTCGSVPADDEEGIAVLIWRYINTEERPSGSRVIEV